MAKAPREGSTTPTVALGPWPLGIDNVQREDARVFEPAMRPDAPPARLRIARDVDLDDAGWPRTRQRASARALRASSEGEWRLSGRRFSQVNGELFEDWSEEATPLVSDLVRRAELAEHAGLIYGTDGATHFEIDGTTVRNWGLPVPVITATATAGAGLAAGSYLVQASFRDARGNEGGACALASVTTTAANGQITVAIAAGAETTGATHLNVYVGQLDQPHASFASSVALASLPAVVTAVTGAGDPPPADALRGPPSGLVGVCSYRAFLLGWRDNIVFRSEAAEPHLFDPEAILAFEGTVRAVRGVVDGLWVATDSGLVWVAGEDPAGWIPVRKSTSAAAAGSLLLRGALLPAAQTPELVALFATEDGLVAGLPGGGLLALTEGRYRFDPGSRCDFCYAEHEDLRQLLIAVT